MIHKHGSRRLRPALLLIGACALFGCARPDATTPTALAGSPEPTASAAPASRSANHASPGSTTATSLPVTVATTSASAPATSAIVPSAPGPGTTHSPGTVTNPGSSAPAPTTTTPAPPPPTTAPVPANTPVIDPATTTCTALGATTHWAVDVRVNGKSEHVEHDQGRGTVYNAAFTTDGVDYTLVVEIDDTGACTSITAFTGDPTSEE